MCCLLRLEVQRIIVRELLLRYFHTCMLPILAPARIPSCGTYPTNSVFII